MFSLTKHKNMKRSKNDAMLGLELGEELSVPGSGGEENHIVMNERVQALAGSIYEVINTKIKKIQVAQLLTICKPRYFNTSSSQLIQFAELALLSNSKQSMFRLSSIKS